jgi:hypothetical protein
VLLLGFAFILLLVWTCIPATGPILAAAGIAFGLALILLALWLIFCGGKCNVTILLWQVLLVVDVLGIFLSGCCPWLLAVGIGLFLLAVALFFVWVRTCNPSSCVRLRELTAAFVVGAAPALDYLSQIAPPCGVGSVKVAVSSIGAVLASATLAICVSQGSGSARRMLRR